MSGAKVLHCSNEKQKALAHMRPIPFQMLIIFFIFIELIYAHVHGSSTLGCNTVKSLEA